MQHGLRHRQGAFPHLPRGSSNWLSGSSAVHTPWGDRESRSTASTALMSPVSDGIEGSVEFVELNLIEVQLVQKGGRRGFELLGGLPQPTEHGIRIDLEDPRRAADAQPLGQTRDDAHDDPH